jgi:CRISPR-associated endonuclease/helicase Cas3
MEHHKSASTNVEEDRLGANGYFNYWGKAHSEDEVAQFHLLAFHSLDVAAVGVELLERDTQDLLRISELSGFDATSLRFLLPYLLSLHDLGKFGEPFQDQRPDLVAQLQGRRDPRQSRHRHDSLGYLLWRSWAARVPDHREPGLLEDILPVMLPTGQLGRRDLDEVMQSWMAAVLGHHGKPPEEGGLSADVFKAHPASPLARSRQDAAAFARAAKALLAQERFTCCVDDVDELISRMKRTSWWIAGVASLSDSLGSDATYFPYASTPKPLAAYWEDARKSAARAVANSGLGASTPRAFAGIATLFPGIAAQPTPLQKTAAEVDLGIGPQLFVLEDLTGSGKTEAALIIAQRLMSSGQADGLFFALPTMATANAMHSRVQPLVDRLFDGRPSYLLTHSGPRLTEQDRLMLARGPHSDSRREGEHPSASHAAAAWLADGRKKALLAELGVGTIDQALLAVMQSKHSALRLLGLHRHVLIVDEVHACDAYMLGVLGALLRAHAALGGTAVLLSATLPLEHRQKLARAFAQGLGENGGAPSSAAYPLLTALGTGRLLERSVAPRDGAPRVLTVRWHRSAEAAVRRLCEAARAGQCAVWVRNSVADALESYDAVVEALGPDLVTLFHARFALGDRLRIEQRVVDCFGEKGTAEQRRGRVVVATQVVEQSLDIDFDVMVTDLCPIDLLIQRAGRLQRHRHLHPGRQEPVLEILAPPWADQPPPGWLGGPFRRTARVYDDPGVLWRTAREMQQRGRLDLPRDARELVEAVYGSTEVPASLQPRSALAEGQEMAHASLAQNAVVKLDLGYLREGADWSSEAYTPTRIGEPTTTVRLARVDPNGARPWETSLEARLHWPLSQLSVARRLISRAAAGDEPLRRQLEDTQPFLGEDVVTVLLREQSPGLWCGLAIADRGREDSVSEVEVKVMYSALRGLEVLHLEGA